MTITDENPLPRDNADPMTSLQEHYYALASSGPAVNPSTIYQPLTVSILEKESGYATIPVMTNAGSDNRGVDKGREPPPQVQPHTGINTAHYVNTQIIPH